MLPTFHRFDFGPAAAVRHLHSPIDADEFAAFEARFRPFVDRRADIYRAIPGGAVWPEFEPPREKILEYYLTEKALALPPGARVLDGASCLSLFPNYAAEVLGWTMIRQDMLYESGPPEVAFPRVTAEGTTDIHFLAGDACALQLEDEVLDAITLHCSFEHFEGDGDRRLVAEAMRVLRPGGKLLIIPFYLGAGAFNEFVREDFASGCQFTRYYDPAHFVMRVLAPLDCPVEMELRYHTNYAEVDKSFYCAYSLVIVKGRRHPVDRVANWLKARWPVNGTANSASGTPR